jgi:fibronectin type 3 domain-containing protein
VALRWRKNAESDFLRYRIYSGTSANPTSKSDSTAGGIGDTTKTILSLTNGTRYYFRVTAVDNAQNESGYSNEVNAKPGDYVPPSAPQTLVATDSSSGTITVKWRKNTDADFLRYRIYLGALPGPTSKIDSTTAGVSDTSKTFSGLVNGTRYYLRITAVDSAGNESAYSNEVSAMPSAGNAAPSAPISLVVTDSSSWTITIKWRKNNEADFLRYRVYRSIAPSPATKVDSTTAGVSDTSKTFTGLSNGIRYYFRISAVDSAGNESGYSNEVNAAPADRVAPGAPQNLVVTDSTSTKIGIKWRKQSDADFLRYRIYRGTSSSTTTRVDSTTGGATADTSKTFTGLTNGTRYYLRVTAVDSSGNESAYSNEVNGAPNAALAVVDLNSQIPKEYSLSQNFPNPFNPTTVIRYGLPTRSLVKLEIYNMLGQSVALLADEEQDARFYVIKWQAPVSSGLYFYRLQAVSTDDPNKSFVQVRKMLLLK